MSLTTENPALVPIISSEEIAAQLKAKYPNIEIFLLEVDMSDEKEHESPNSNYRPKSVYQAVLKKPGRRELGLAMASGKDPLQMAESLIRVVGWKVMRKLKTFSTKIQSVFMLVCKRWSF
jgi:hypothetical protein